MPLVKAFSCEMPKLEWNNPQDMPMRALPSHPLSREGRLGFTGEYKSGRKETSPLSTRVYISQVDTLGRQICGQSPWP